MRGLVNHNRAPLLCHSFSSCRRLRPCFKPFSVPAALTRERSPSAGNSRRAVLSTPDKVDVATDRPLQEQLRDQIQLHQLQRAGVPDEALPEDLLPSQSTSSQQPSQTMSSKGKRTESSSGRAKNKTKSSGEIKPSSQNPSPQAVVQSDPQISGKAPASTASSRRTASSRKAKLMPEDGKLNASKQDAAESSKAATAAVKGKRRPGRPAKQAKVSAVAGQAAQFPTKQLAAKKKSGQQQTALEQVAEKAQRNVLQGDNSKPAAAANAASASAVKSPRTQAAQLNAAAAVTPAAQQSPSLVKARQTAATAGDSITQAANLGKSNASKGTVTPVSADGLSQTVKQGQLPIRPGAKRGRDRSQQVGRYRQTSQGSVSATSAAKTSVPGRAKTMFPSIPLDFGLAPAKHLTLQEDTVLCSAVQDAAFIEMHRRRIYSTQPVEESRGRDAEPVTDARPIAADDYQRMKQWKDAVGAGTFSQLNARLDRGERAKQMLLHYNQNLVRQLVWRTTRSGWGTGIGFDEMVAVGEEALVAAAAKFDPIHKAKFSTYAYLRILRAIQNHIKAHEDIVRIPNAVKDLAYKMRPAVNKLAVVLGRDPTAEEIALEMNVPVSRVVLAMSKTGTPVALDAKPLDEDKHPLADLVADTPDEGSRLREKDPTAQPQFSDDVENILEALPHREGEVLALRYGIFDNKPQSLAEVAQFLKLSHEGVRKNEQSAFRRLRQAGMLGPLMKYFADVALPSASKQAARR